MHGVGIGACVRQERPHNLMDKQVANDRQGHPQRQGENQGKTQGLFEPLPQLRSHAVAQQRLNALPQPHADHTCNRHDLHGNPHPGHGHVVVPGHLAVDDDLGDAHQQGAQRRRNADHQNAAAHLVFQRKVLQADAQGGFAPREIEDVVERTGHIPDHRRDCRACDIPAKTEYHDRVKNDIQQVTYDLPHHGLAGPALGTNHIGIAVGDQHEGPA